MTTPNPQPIVIRPALPDDWPAIWRFIGPVIAAGETFSWDQNTAEDKARASWCHEPPGRTFVAVEADGTIVGSAELRA